MGELRPHRLDGGLATTLQCVGLPRYSPVEPWVLEHPEAVRAAHQAFVDAGAGIVLTATFRCLPSERADWAQVAPRAVELARSTGASTWLTLGPGEGYADVVQAVDGIDGVVLETFVDPGGLVDAIREVRTVWRGPLVGSLVPLEPLSDGVPALLQGAGADGVGLNCCSVDAVLAQLERWGTDVPLWLKPHPDGLERLLPHAAWLGGCCGTLPAHLERLWRP